MPVVLTNLKPATLKDIQRLVDAGHYTSPADFLELAAVNQLQLEGDRMVSGVKAASRSEAWRPERHKPAREKRGKRAGGVDEREILETLGRLILRIDIEPPSDLIRNRPATSDGEGRIWGQINRLFPLKFALRWVAARAVADKKWSLVEDVLELAAMDAATMGSALEKADAHADRNRDQLLATGLPRIGNASSASRFLSQYIARITRTAIYPGTAVQYGLASVDGGQLALTTTGFEFASLRNPIIDGDLAQATATFSAEEREFFVQHAVPYVRSELHDFSHVLSFVGTGQNTPSEQIDLLGTHLPEDWSDSQVRTHVTGVVARMVDLGLLRRQWRGRRVQYETTQSATLLSNVHVIHQGDHRA